MISPTVWAVWCLAWLAERFIDGDWLQAAILLCLALFYVAVIERMEWV